VTEYAFGDSDLARERLRILDTVFAPTTDALLAEVRTEPDRVALLARLHAREGDDTRGLFTWTHHQTVVRAREAHVGP
jgi:hypothetical protein